MIFIELDYRSFKIHTPRNTAELVTFDLTYSSPSRFSHSIIQKLHSRPIWSYQTHLNRWSHEHAKKMLHEQSGYPSWNLSASADSRWHNFHLGIAVLLNISFIWASFITKKMVHLIYGTCDTADCQLPSEKMDRQWVGLNRRPHRWIVTGSTIWPNLLSKFRPN